MPGDLGPAVALSAGADHTCALLASQRVRCWGNGSDGQTTVPADLAGVAGLAAGAAHTCAVTTNGAVRCWGSNGALESRLPAYGDPTGGERQTWLPLVRR